MSHERHSLSEQIKPDEPETSFRELSKELKSNLDELQKQITTGEGIFDPVIQKKKELFVRINLARHQLGKKWKDSQQEETSPQLVVAMQELNSIVCLIKNLTVSEKDQAQKAAKKQIEAFNTSIASGFVGEYKLLRSNTHRITKLKYGEDISDYMSYTAVAANAVVTVGLAWFSTLGEAAKAAGSIFYPISATFTSSAKLFNFLRRTIQFFIASNEAHRAEINELRKLELANTKALLKKSAALKLLAFSLNALSALAFAGVLATPIGWALVAAATLADWIDDGLGAYQRANKTLQKFKTEHAAELGENDPKIASELTALQEKANRAKSEAQWGFASTIAMVLFACGPIPFVGPFLGLAGLATFGIILIRNTYVAAKPYVKKQVAPTVSDPSTEEPTQQQEAATPTPTRAPQEKQDAAVSMRTAPRLKVILSKPDPSTESKKASLHTRIEKPTQTDSYAATKKSPSLFRLATSNQPLSSTGDPKMNGGVDSISNSTKHRALKGG